MSSLGSRIRHYRGQMKLTAKEMAEKMNVSPSTISKIENDKISPSMEMLQNISQVINVPMGHLFMEGDIDNLPSVNTLSPVSVVRKNQRRRLILYNSDIHLMLLSPSFHGRTELAIMEIMPGQSSGAPKRHPVGEEFIFVIEGCLSLTVNNEKYILEDGDSVTFDATVLHSYCNDSNRKTVIIAGNTPPVF